MEPDVYNRKSFEEESKAIGIGTRGFSPHVHLGEPAPDFEAVTLDGDRVRLSDFKGKKHVVFGFGCITAPVFIGSIPGWNGLAAGFRDEDIQFFIIYVREAHPGEHYDAHTSFEQKLDHARQLKEIENVELPILVDSLSGDIHSTYGMHPSPAFVVDKTGTLVYRATWALHDEIEVLLKRLIAADNWKDRRPRVVQSEGIFLDPTDPDLRIRVLNRAGPRALAEVRRVLGI